MTSQLALRLGAQVPQLRHSPPDVHNLDAADAAIELANAYDICEGHPLDASQEWRLRNALGRRTDGMWAAPTVGDFGGRQGAGKTVCIEARELVGLIVLNEQLQMHTAHEFPTTNESFLKMAGLFTEWDDLRKRVKRIRYANGEQAIELTSGQRLKYKARTAGGGRGFRKADLLVYDEAQHIQGEHVAASGPTRLANPNPQAWYAGSGGLAGSHQAWALRRRALSGKGGRLAYSEFTGQRVELVDGKVQLTNPEPDDRDAWAMANPGLGRWVTEEGMEVVVDELGELAPRECMCVWEPELGTDGGGNMPNWSQCGDEVSVIASHHMWAIATSPDRKWSTIGVAGWRADDKRHVATQYRRSGTDWVIDEAVAFWKSCKIPVRIWKNGPEASFIALLRERGVQVVEVSTPEVSQATGQMRDGVEAGTVRHPVHESGALSALDRAVAGAELRTSSDGASLWSQKLSTVEITPLVACTVALGGVPNEVRPPRVYSLATKGR